jgi:L-ascorbate metabolism protein UlaG (beta-lactamase superfamily)
MLLALILVVASILMVVLLGYFLSGPKYAGPVSDHFDGIKFFTPGGRPARGLGGVLQWMIKRERGKWHIQMDTPYGQKPISSIHDGIHITFVNHSTFLIQTGGINILTDPVWSERTSPFSWAGPKRMRPPGIRFEDLPNIDLVLLSHNHYDHLDVITMKRLFDMHNPRIITPLGVKAFLESLKINGSVELDWWQKITVNETIEIQAVPAQHFSGRGMYDRDATLWCGYLINRPKGSIYFVGDTGYHEALFKEIGERVPVIDVALVPIGAFKPEWFMSPIHCSPEEAVRIHQDVKARRSIATHFGTFPLADDGMLDPVTELQKALARQNLSSDHFLILKEGETKQF